MNFPSKGKGKVLFGLPEEVRFCTTCVISNQRPSSAIEFSHTIDSVKKTIVFDESGRCDACKFADIKNSQIDWESREKELLELSRKYRDFPGPFNCIVPGSGGKDSFFQSHVLKYKYGFRPLTVTWAPHIHTQWGWRNFQRWISSGFDNFLVTPNTKIHRLLTRLAVDNLFHPFQPFIIGQKALAPKLAARFNIPLIFYGENEAEYGNSISDNDKSLRQVDYYASNDSDQIFLSGVAKSELISRYGIDDYELSLYLPENLEVVSDFGIQVHYLGHFLKWHPQSTYYYAVENGGFEPSPERTPGTYSKYNSIDDKVDDLHYWTTFIKFGIGRATYDASQEIRSGDITREEGVALVRQYDGEWPARFESELMTYLSIDNSFGKIGKEFIQPVIDKEYLLELSDSFRSPHLWEYNGGQYKLRHQVT